VPVLVDESEKITIVTCTVFVSFNLTFESLYASLKLFIFFNYDYVPAVGTMTGPRLEAAICLIMLKG
jgi:hypothetical protein